MKELTFALSGALSSGLLVLLATGPSAPQAEPDADDGLITLYADDDIASSFSFREGRHAARVERGEIALDDVQLVYDVYAEDALSYGFARDELVAVVDLGEVYVPEFQRATDPALGFPLSVFHTLFRDGPHFAYVNNAGKTVRIRQADRILNTIVSTELTHFEPKLRHTYLIRFRSRTKRAYDQVAKFQIVEVVPGERVTLRWENLGEL
jgi:hypothetical protein